MSINRAFLADAAQSIDDRVAHLLEQMTLDEKIAQLGSYWVYELLDKMMFSPAKAQKLLVNGVGHITRIGGASNVRPAESAALANAIQKHLIENTRLGIPAVIHEECCSGYMARGATVFPQAIGVASTWQPELVEAMADVIRQQMRSVGGHHALAPVLDVTRDARWGRVEETFGEDAYLVARMGAAYINGIQGDDLTSGVIATGKHFVGYGMSEGGLNWAPPHIGWRELHEVYLFPFEAAVREAKLASIMNAYHEIDGVPCGSSKWLLTDLLRGEWGFEGTVVSDYFAVNMLTEYHHTARDKAEAAFMALDAGIDVELPNTDCYGQRLREAVERGDIPVDLIDLSVRRLLAQKFALGVFEQPYVDASAVAFDTPDQRQLAREIAQQSLVLLKNDGDTLPLSKDLQSIAVIGPNADSTRNLFGDYAYPAHIETLLEFKRKNVFNTPVPEGIEAADDFIRADSILTAIKNKVGAGVEVYYAQGCEVMDESTQGFAEAVAAARKAQIAVVVVGDKAGLTDDCTSGEARDRAELGLPGVQAQLVKAVYETGMPIVLVLVNGRPVTLDWMADSAPNGVAAVLEAWFPSEEGANAVVDALFGDINPGGKLPITFPRSVGQVPIYYGHKPSGGRSHWKVDYVETSVEPLYPFGHGLSYTRFQFDNLRIASAEAQAGESVSIRVDVSNIGQRAGDEVVQLYTHQNVPMIARPVQELKGFQRVSLDAGQTKTIRFDVAVNQLGYYDMDNRFVVSPGKVDVMLGSSAHDIHCNGSFTIVGATTEIGAGKAFFSRSVVE
ncbi:MAG: glycoside hydrolase family 3 C-terminal domain-containing protein [Burkholderiales bacterium]|nr:glycoside hydrolase family 3 C-terminal domain-containing protein [Anaerolineae bacterium]